MSNHERMIMDLTTPHGIAQARLDELVAIAAKYKTRVQFNPADKSIEPFHPSIAQEATIFDAPRIAPDSNTANSRETVHGGHKKKPIKQRKTHETTGLNGFYHGTFFRDGVAQGSKRKPRK